MADRSSIFKILSFKEIDDIVREDRLELLGRSNEQHELYMTFIKDIIPKNYVSVIDYLLITKLDLEFELVNSDTNTDSNDINSRNGKINGVCSRKKVKRQFSVGSTVVKKLLKNDFPYNFEKGMSSIIFLRYGNHFFITLYYHVIFDRY